MQLFQELKQTFHTGDAEVRSWFLIEHNYLPLILCSSYALFSWVIGPALMKNRKPFDLRMFMIVFNFLMVIAYTLALSIIFWNLPKLSRELFCQGGVKVQKGSLVYKLVSWLWVIYVLKYAAFFDTAFFILRKKNNLITFLHVMHHAAVPLLGWTMLRTEQSGFQTIPVFINAFVHVIMYTYYGLAAMGPQVRKYLWWKKYLTQLQIIQFFLIIGFVLIIAPLTGCRMMKTSYLIDFIFGSIFLYLFYIFYISNYKSKKTN